jgi:hypothetical protein
MFFTAGLVLMEKKRPWSAGIAFSLCICKFHLAMAVPVMLVAQKRWKTLIAGAVSFVVLISAGFLIEGPRWPFEYLKNSQSQSFSPAFEAMPNISALVSRLPWGTELEIFCALAVLAILWAMCRTGEIGIAGAATAAAGLLISHHALAADTTLLIPLAVLTVQRQAAPFWLRAGALLILSPLPLLLILSHNSLVWQMLTVAFSVAAMVALKAMPRERPAAEPADYPSGDALLGNAG